MKLFMALITLTLLSTQVAMATTTNQQLSSALAQNLSEVEKSGAAQLGLQSLSIDGQSLNCQGQKSWSSQNTVGVCTATGNLDYPNSYSKLAIIASENLLEGKLEYTVRVLNSEL